MASFTLPNLAVPQPRLRTRRQNVYVRDVYNFSTTSVSQGTDQPVVSIPPSGPHAAGAVFPTKYQTVDKVEVAPTGVKSGERTEAPPAYGDVNGK